MFYYAIYEKVFHPFKLVLTGIYKLRLFTWCCRVSICWAGDFSGKYFTTRICFSGAQILRSCKGTISMVWNLNSHVYTIIFWHFLLYETKQNTSAYRQNETISILIAVTNCYLLTTSKFLKSSLLYTILNYRETICLVYFFGVVKII